MTVFPTTSTNVLEVRAGKYDTAQLAREILRRLDGEQMARSKLPGKSLGLSIEYASWAGSVSGSSPWI